MSKSKSKKVEKARKRQIQKQVSASFYQRNRSMFPDIYTEEKRVRSIASPSSIVIEEEAEEDDEELRFIREVGGEIRWLGKWGEDRYDVFEGIVLEREEDEKGHFVYKVRRTYPSFQICTIKEFDWIF